METSKSKLDLATRVAVLYYGQDQNQNEIAQTLGISRSYVSQLLAIARENNIVTITINAGSSYIAEADFSRKHGLKQAYILPSQSEEYTTREFGRFCVPHTLRLIRNAKHIGINLGKTVYEMISAIPKDEVLDCNVKSVMQIMGGSETLSLSGMGTMPNELVYKMGQLLNCQCLYMNCPALIYSSTARKLLLEEATIQSIYKAWENLDVVLMGMGNAGDSMLFKNMPKLRHKIINAQAVADINLNFFDARGHYLPLLDEHKMALDYEKLKKVKTKIVYAHGAQKAIAIAAALRAEMIDVLFTDEITAKEVNHILSWG
jgi:deoxyribonucleoside regulator